MIVFEITSVKCYRHISVSNHSKTKRNNHIILRHFEDSKESPPLNFFPFKSLKKKEKIGFCTFAVISPGCLESSVPSFITNKAHTHTLSQNRIYLLQVLCLKQTLLLK